MLLKELIIYLAKKCRCKNSYPCIPTVPQLASELSSTDVKELIPEFYYLPDFLSNVNGYDFGRKQDGEVRAGLGLV